MSPVYRFPVGLEEGSDGATHVHSFTLPGCVASGTSKEAALELFPRVLSPWLRFLSEQGERTPSRDGELEIIVEEWLSTDAAVARGESDVCFDADRAPIAQEEMMAGLRRLGALRGRLVPSIRRMSNEQLERLGDPRLPLRTILEELARAQWWTLTRLGASPLAEVPERVVARLDTSMALVVQQLAEPPATANERVVEMEGEEWTPRKVLRRLLWLEWTLGGAALHALHGQGSGATPG